jgi:hypothetical protein
MFAFSLADMTVDFSLSGSTTPFARVMLDPTSPGVDVSSGSQQLHFPGVLKVLRESDAASLVPLLALGKAFTLPYTLSASVRTNALWGPATFSMSFSDSYAMEGANENAPSSTTTLLSFALASFASSSDSGLHVTSHWRYVLAENSPPYTYMTVPAVSLHATANGTSLGDIDLGSFEYGPSSELDASFVMSDSLPADELAALQTVAGKLMHNRGFTVSMRGAGFASADANPSSCLMQRLLDLMPEFDYTVAASPPVCSEAQMQLIVEGSSVINCAEWLQAGDGSYVPPHEDRVLVPHFLELTQLHRPLPSAPASSSGNDAGAFTNGGSPFFRVRADLGAALDLSYAVSGRMPSLFLDVAYADGSGERALGFVQVEPFDIVDVHTSLLLNVSLVATHEALAFSALLFPEPNSSLLVTGRPGENTLSDLLLELRLQIPLNPFPPPTVNPSPSPTMQYNVTVADGSTFETQLDTALVLREDLPFALSVPAMSLTAAGPSGAELLAIKLPRLFLNQSGTYQFSRLLSVAVSQEQAGACGEALRRFADPLGAGLASVSLRGLGDASQTALSASGSVLEMDVHFAEVSLGSLNHTLAAFDALTYNDDGHAPAVKNMTAGLTLTGLQRTPERLSVQTAVALQWHGWPVNLFLATPLELSPVVVAMDGLEVATVTLAAVSVSTPREASALLALDLAQQLAVKDAVLDGLPHTFAFACRLPADASPSAASLLLSAFNVSLTTNPASSTTSSLPSMPSSTEGSKRAVAFAFASDSTSMLLTADLSLSLDAFLALPSGVSWVVSVPALTLEALGSARSDTRLPGPLPTDPMLGLSTSSLTLSDTLSNTLLANISASVTGNAQADSLGSFVHALLSDLSARDTLFASVRVLGSVNGANGTAAGSVDIQLNDFTLSQANDFFASPGDAPATTAAVVATLLADPDLGLQLLLLLVSNFYVLLLCSVMEMNVKQPLLPGVADVRGYSVHTASQRLRGRRRLRTHPHTALPAGCSWLSVDLSIYSMIYVSGCAPGRVEGCALTNLYSADAMLCGAATHQGVLSSCGGLFHMQMHTSADPVGFGEAAFCASTSHGVSLITITLSCTVLLSTAFTNPSLRCTPAVILIPAFDRSVPRCRPCCPPRSPSLSLSPSPTIWVWTRWSCWPCR